MTSSNPVNSNPTTPPRPLRTWETPQLSELPVSSTAGGATSNIEDFTGGTFFGPLSDGSSSGS